MNWWDQLGTGIGDSLLGLSQPFGLGSGMPQMTPDQRQAGIRQGAASLGAGVLANGTQPPLQAFGNAYMGTQDRGAESYRSQLWAQQIQNAAEKQRREQEGEGRWSKFLESYNGPNADALRSMPAAESFDLYTKMQGAEAKQRPTSVQDIGGKKVLIYDDTGETIKELGMSPNRQQNAPSGYRFTDDTNTKLEAIEGGPATKMPAEVSGRVAMLDTAEKDMPAAEKVFMKPYTGMGGAALNTAEYYTNSGEYGRATRTVTMAIEAALRAMTGAAAPESEVANYRNLFLPHPTDGLETTKQKLAGLKSFMAKARTIMLQGRTSGTDQAQPIPEPTNNEYNWDPENGLSQ